MKKFKLLLIILFFTLMLFNYSTSPTPPPYHRFIVSGEIVCDSLSNKSNFAITLYGKSQQTNNYFVRAFSHESWNSNTALTDSIGFYLLVADNDFEFDSIRTAIIQPGKEPIFSQPYFVDKANLTVVYKKVGRYDNNSGCCSNYSVDIPQEDIAPERYEYRLSNVAIELCD